MALDLKDDEKLIAAYEQYHQQGHMWPEISVGISDAGIADMQIYRIGSRLFMVVDCDEGISIAKAFEKMSTMPRQQEWAVLMSYFQEVLPQAAEGEHWVAMKPVFLLKEHVG